MLASAFSPHHYTMENFLKLLEYNFWANDLFITRLLSQPKIPIKIVSQMSHLLGAHRIWLDRVGGRGSLPSAWDEIETEYWEGINIELYNETSDLLKSIALNTTISYQNSQGQTYHNTLEEIIQHLLNHSTHHRAQVALLMRQHQMLPPQSDYIVYLRK